MPIAKAKLPVTAQLDCYEVTGWPIRGADEDAPWFFRPRSLSGIGSYAWFWRDDQLKEVIVEEETAPDREDWWRSMTVFDAAKYARQAIEEHLEQMEE